MDKKVLIGLIGLVVVIVGVVVGIVLINQQKKQDIRILAEPQTVLSLIPANSTPDVNEEFDVAVNIDTGQNQVYSVNLDIVFEPSKLQAVSVTAGNFFPFPMITGPDIDNTGGKIAYTLTIPLTSTPRQGSGNLANIKFEAVSAGTTQVSFGPGTTVSASNEQNALQDTTEATITIQETSITPTPTPTPTGGGTTTEPGSGEPTATPSPTATSSATGGTSGTTPTPTSASKGGVTPTSLPDSGIGDSTFVLGGIGLSAFILLAVVLLAL